MAMKGFQQLMAEANAAVPTIDVAEAMSTHQDGDAIFVDVRETEEWMQGRIPGAVHAPRGFLEFIADPASPMHKPELSSGKRLMIYCGSGGRSVLATKTLADMGLDKVANIAGGFQAWVGTGGDIET
ncbi:MAG: rhodanese-like domain-containing protein [Alphaproteobacteria bacterium]|nr:rhodanese-like domain-containing protein [Alphaproteobacteria bacterium]